MTIKTLLTTRIYIVFIATIALSSLAKAEEIELGSCKEVLEFIEQEANKDPMDTPEKFREGAWSSKARNLFFLSELQSIEQNYVQQQKYTKESCSIKVESLGNQQWSFTMTQHYFKPASDEEKKKLSGINGTFSSRDLWIITSGTLGLEIKDKSIRFWMSNPMDIKKSFRLMYLKGVMSSGG